MTGGDGEAARVVVTEPGVYDMPAEDYHADPVPGGSLSSSGARLLLPPGCPATFRHRLDHPQHTDYFDFGTAAHQLVLGAGPRVMPVDAEDWRAAGAREQRAAARAAGMVPLLADDYERARAMARVVREHPVASRLFTPGSGLPEQSLFWVDGPSGVWRRARLDWLPRNGPGRLIVADYKTTSDASADGVQRAVGRYGYHQQAAWYLDAVHALNLAADAAFLLVFQERDAPHPVTVAELHPVDLAAGRDRNRAAINLYRRCRDSGRWPGHGDDVRLITLPPWAARSFEDAVRDGEYDILETPR